MSSVPDRVRRPEYTGDQRCWPCTAVNSVVLAVAVVAVAFWRLPAAVAVGVVGAAVIAVRGYLVPYTPQFAPGLVSRLPGDPFHADGGREIPEETGALADRTDAPDGEELLGALVQAGVVEPEGESLFLNEQFRDLWHEEIDRLRTLDLDALAAETAAVSPVEVEAEAVTQGGREHVVLTAEGTSTAAATWLGKPVAIAETAAVRVLGETIPQAEADVRAAAADPLRMFLEECPACGTPVEERSTRHCCGGSDDPTSPPDEVLACPECNERVYTFPDESGA